jgi:trans-aconitate methyltransferase
MILADKLGFPSLAAGALSQTPAAQLSYPWQTCLDIEGQDAGHYHDFVNHRLLDLVLASPKRVLELGCAGGQFGAELKARFPGATVVGVEVGHAAAARAATRIDRVIRSRVEDVDYAAEGFREGEFDMLVAADVLEHLVNPWDALVRARAVLAPGAQVVASIPNLRNLMLVEALVCAGAFRYGERGLLDITHLRFFPLREVVRLFQETGYRVDALSTIVSPPLVEWHREHRDKPAATIQVGRLTLADVTSQEIDELCAEQFLLRAHRV